MEDLNLPSLGQTGPFKQKILGNENYITMLAENQRGVNWSCG